MPVLLFTNVTANRNVLYYISRTKHTESDLDGFLVHYHHPTHKKKDKHNAASTTSSSQCMRQGENKIKK